MDSFLFNIFFVSLQPKRICNQLHKKNSSYKFSTATAILGCLKQTTIKNNKRKQSAVHRLTVKYEIFKTAK